MYGSEYNIYRTGALLGACAYDYFHSEEIHKICLIKRIELYLRAAYVQYVNHDNKLCDRQEAPIHK